ncbi:MAG: hypothetical protein ROO76_07325 [Terriglobia bacterium]|nr:hypothetical protein [Terriglobia bacterium]
MNPRIPASVHVPRLRTTAIFAGIIVCVCSTPAFAGDNTQQSEPEKILAVSVTITPQNAVAEALDARDLEHFVVTDLKRHRISSVPDSSVEDTLDSDDGVYAVDLFIDQAEIAQRPRWDWFDHQYRDDEILHLELSLVVTRLSDREQLGSLNLYRDYQAEEYGRFLSPQAVRGAVYEAVTNLSAQFSDGVSKGDFGAEIGNFQHPFAPADAFDLWHESSLGEKVLSGLVIVVTLVVSIALACAIFGAFFSWLARLCGLSRPAPQIVYVDHRPRGLKTRKPPTVLEGYEPPDEEDEDETEEDEEEVEESA